ncbi:Small subunit (SSU) processome component [Physocladia obscura]|uniref:Small subunit (SSU) processome component n=1 Tax=Physocladia obscura TaxID=109957 RepID=A0AAD5SQ04_9FUNG|nr:Small subunit (SSU) processome component [Physocladia obscura]
MNITASTTALANGSAATSNDQEMSIQDRLTQLNLSTADIPETQSDKKIASSKKLPPGLATPTATSLYNLLTQAIHSGDKQLLEQCLQVSDSIVITASVKRLNPGHVVPFLNMLTTRLQIKPTRAAKLIEWIRAVVVCHAAFLMTNPALVVQLSSLHATLTARTETFSKLLKLSGRLDLVTSQIEMRASRAQFEDEDDQANEDAGDDEEGGRPVVYDEENEDEEDENEDDDDDDDDDNENAMDEDEELYSEDEESEDENGERFDFGNDEGDEDFDEDADLEDME